ncbi:hypothetical protein GCM10023195_55160 [Actinoallomurus liliacearum]|uniref:DUF222 domain-containing protein n=1 Tax=Actinoallomurus liliacearum TaxID=1080073 RepID=A0ABP8TRF7_9ACTN
MTRNRSRKDKIRTRQQVTGESYAEAARKINARRRPIEELLRDAAEGVRAVSVDDTLATVQAAWTALCAIGAAGEVLALCADPDDYPPRWLLAEPILAEAISSLRALPSLRGNNTEANPAGGPDDDIDEETADLICRELTEAADTLAAVLPQAAKHARTKAIRRACRLAADPPAT